MTEIAEHIIKKVLFVSSSITFGKKAIDIETAITTTDIYDISNGVSDKIKDFMYDDFFI